MYWRSENDFGTKITYKCHLPIQRRKRTLDGEWCSNWQLIDSFGVRFNSNSPITATKSYENFYDERKTQDFYLIATEFKKNFHFFYNKFLLELNLQVVEQYITLKKRQVAWKICDGESSVSQRRKWLYTQEWNIWTLWTYWHKLEWLLLQKSNEK